MGEPLSQVNVTVGSKPSSAANVPPPPPPPPAPPPAQAPPHVHPKSGSLFFDDGKRRIDFVLVFEKDESEAETNVAGTEPVNPSSSTNVLKRLEGFPRIGAEAMSDVERERLRLFFESNLITEGLELEEDVRKEEDGRMTVFVKVTAPWLILCKQAEALKIKMPLKLRDTFVQPTDSYHSIFNRFIVPVRELVSKLKKKLFDAASTTALGSRIANLNSRIRPGTATLRESSDSKSKSKNEPRRVMWQFRRKKVDRFDADDHQTFFSPTQRMEMVWEILQKVRNDPDDEKRRGIEMLLHTGVYEAAFPLHDASDDATGKHTAAPISEWPQRQLLRHTWATWKALFKRQPLDLIRSYYGEKIAFYFAFLGFYTKMLIFPAIFGTCAFLFGIFYDVDDEMIDEICNATAPPGNYFLCPVCDPRVCEITQYHKHCEKAWMANWMDNEATVLVACVTVAWTTVFLKSWKRREAELAFEWDVHEVGVGQDDEPILPDYEHRAPANRPNPVTRQTEPYVPPMLRYRWKAASTAITLLMLLAVGCALVSLVIARIALYKALKGIGIEENVEVARWLVHGLIFITVVIFDAFYTWVAEKITSLECPRTQSEWLSSFLWKVFIFELLNDFVPIAYAAWVKGRTVKTPLDLDWKSELCDANGCMGEVTELIAVLLLARMFVGNAAEIGVPFLKHYLNRFVCDTASVTGAVSSKPHHHNNQANAFRANRRATVMRQQRGRPGGSRREHGRDQPINNHLQKSKPPNIDNRSVQGNEVEIEEKRWRSDVLLGELELDGVANEYMEMIVQFAFCTLFVPAFPIAALVCFLNNILEIRVDAIKILASHRRPLPIRVSGIGIWNEFLAIIGKVAVLCNAGLIAFTSDAIVRLYYNLSTTKTYSYAGYPMWSMSEISAGDMIETWPDIEHEVHELGLEACYYAGLQEKQFPYPVDLKWWRVACVRLGAFGVFVALGFTFQFVYDALVPDVPEHVAVRIQRQRYVIAKAMESEQAYENWLKIHGVVLTSQKKDDKGRSPSLVPSKQNMTMFRQHAEKPRMDSVQKTKVAWSHPGT